MVNKAEKGIVEKYLIKIPFIYYTFFFFGTLFLIWGLSSFELSPKIIFSIGVVFTWFIVAYAKVSYKDLVEKSKGTGGKDE